MGQQAGAHARAAPEVQHPADLHAVVLGRRRPARRRPGARGRPAPRLRARRRPPCPATRRRGRGGRRRGRGGGFRSWRQPTAVRASSAYTLANDARRSDRDHRPSPPAEPADGPRVDHRRARPPLPHRGVDHQPHRDRPPAPRPRPPRHPGPGPRHDRRRAPRRRGTADDVVIRPTRDTAGGATLLDADPPRRPLRAGRGQDARPGLQAARPSPASTPGATGSTS